ncbi:MAG: glycosyltransferase family 4 protein [Chloroflexi bacterium]|nr:glycosyltransferase family 4 protein [Chloroflexota bacterium]
MRIVYVPRADARQMVGGDIIYMMQVKKYIKPLGVEIETVTVNDLRHHGGGDVLHLTQIYQMDVAEAALDWAQSKGMPVVINPLFEAVLPMWFRWAIQRQPKWRYLYKACGLRLAERIYTRWQTARRFRDPAWPRQRTILQKAHVVPNTRYELQHLRDWFNLPDLTGPIVPLGVNVDLYGHWKPSGDQELPAPLQEQCGRYILQVGLVCMRKNQVGLLQALADTRDPIVFLGRPTPHEPEYYEEVRRLAASRGNVTFIEHVDESLLPAIYGHASVHILPSWSERPGMVSLEAAASGCKVISSNRAPIHEYLGDRAWYVDPAHPDQIRAAVHRAMQSKTPVGLRERALEFSWQNTARKLADVYSTIISEGKGPR